LVVANRHRADASTDTLEPVPIIASNLPSCAKPPDAPPTNEISSNREMPVFHMKS
jgi:hypothetical protein